MIKVSVFLTLTRRPDLTHEQFRQYWKEKHAPLVLWFDDLSSLMTISGHQDYASIVAKDEGNFLDRTKTVMFVSSESR